MNIAIVGCGFVFDIYMRTLRGHPELTVVGVFDLNAARMDAVRRLYGFDTYDSLGALLADARVALVVNLTGIAAHFEVSRKALEAGKHVYSEKPLTPDLAQSRALFALAEAKGVRLGAAPSNLYGDSLRTLLRAVEDGAIGKPLLVYAELDDNPIHLAGFEAVRSPSGAPWPLEDEIRAGCTFEHIGYHLVWICALLGPAVSVTAFSDELLEGKSRALPAKVGTPDFSVACLGFAGGAVARITVSVVAPRNHAMQVVGEEGALRSDGYRQYRAPVYLERFSRVGLSARKFRTLRAHPGVARLFGVGGRRLPLVRNRKSGALGGGHAARLSLRRKAMEALRRHEVYAQDKVVGIAEMAAEIAEGRAPFLTPDFLLHVNELTLLVQEAGPRGMTATPVTRFAPLGPIPGSEAPVASYRDSYRPTLLERLLGRRRARAGRTPH